MSGPEQPFTFFTYFFGNLVDHENLHLITAAFVSVLVLAAVIPLYPKIKNAAKNVVPKENFSLLNVFELFGDFIDGLCHQVIGHGHRKYVPFVGTVFIFIFACNLIGMVPGFLPATENWSTGAAVAIIVFFAYHYFGFQETGIAYIKHFGAPMGPGKGILNWVLLIVPITALHILIGSIELISHSVRPFTLSIRLYVNMFADHTVLGVFSGLAPFLVPIPFIILGLFVCFMQAFIFTMLTIVYISGAVAHDH